MYSAVVTTGIYCRPGCGAKPLLKNTRVYESAAAVAREEACQLRCQAAVIEAMSTLYDELGLRAQRWGEFAERIRSFGYPQ
ncbi:Ada metal-binding domain-containing protein [Kibdelosporangium lantanae]|uniref:Ada metal-binding domain-containing protein n=1 Tax=Kibdelosporangium lantanae TaxID=1497396 RepID=A0ABW3M1S4_9PSEU